MAKYSVGDIVMARTDIGIKSLVLIVGTIIDIRYFDSEAPSYMIEWSDGDRNAYTEETVIRYKNLLDKYTKDNT